MAKLMELGGQVLDIDEKPFKRMVVDVRGRPIGIEEDDLTFKMALIEYLKIPTKEKKTIYEAMSVEELAVKLFKSDGELEISSTEETILKKKLEENTAGYGDIAWAKVFKWFTRK